MNSVDGDSGDKKGAFSAEVRIIRELKPPPPQLPRLIWAGLGCAVAAIVCAFATTILNSTPETIVFLWLLAPLLAIAAAVLLWLSGKWIVRVVFGVVAIALYAVFAVFSIHKILTVEAESKTLFTSLLTPSLVVFLVFPIVGILMIRHGIRIRRAQKLNMSPRKSSLTNRNGERSGTKCLVFGMTMFVIGIVGMLYSEMSFASISVIPIMNGAGKGSEVGMLGFLGAVLVFPAFVILAASFGGLAIGGTIALWSWLVARHESLDNGESNGESQGKFVTPTHGTGR